MASTPDGLVLASASAARAELLRAAGIAARSVASGVDEAELKQQHRATGGDAVACAAALAEAKARVVAARYPRALVIGADQILCAGAEWFDKPANLDEAAAQLRRLRGQTHMLVTAACVVIGDACVWHAVTVPKLTMWRFGEAFLASYIAEEGDAVLSSVGAYRLEGRGAQLFARIEGDYFSILGLPLLELLEFLRGRGAIGSED